ncbi:hypothetical protein COCNU_07G000860 [Cocos nucifera]|uniref:Uncharacterized protein n=1 Tax=Cocos nucifera TaxID=13894 RepID=A0A8K0N4S0_COCNU|nr:hypothetical protein COCNU_07G000860 [Cocos nucifera]
MQKGFKKKAARLGVTAHLARSETWTSFSRRFSANHISDEAQDEEERDPERHGNRRSATELHGRMNLGKEKLPLA